MCAWVSTVTFESVQFQFLFVISVIYIMFFKSITQTWSHATISYMYSCTYMHMTAVHTLYMGTLVLTDIDSSVYRVQLHLLHLVEHLLRHGGTQWLGQSQLDHVHHQSRHKPTKATKSPPPRTNRSKHPLHPLHFLLPQTQRNHCMLKWRSLNVTQHHLCLPLRPPTRVMPWRN